MSKGAIGFIVGIIAVVFAASGCGGGGSTALSKPEFEKQANQICLEEEGKRAAELAKALQGSPTQEDAEKVVIKVLPFYEHTAERIDALGAPSGDEKEVEAIVKAMEEAAAKAKADPGTAVTGGLQFREANELAAKYGLKKCLI